MKAKTRMFAGVIVLLVVMAGGALWYFNNVRNAGVDYSQQIKPADFTTKITNKYFALP
jgi:hypothetical protein